MKKFGKAFFLLLCLGIFLTLRFHEVMKKEKPAVFAPQKPAIPAPITITPAHPWLQQQPEALGAQIEIVRDMENIRLLSQKVPNITEKELTGMMMEKLLTLQAALPFSFPKNLYNVLCISDSQGNLPAPYQTYQRLYLAENEMGMPFYLEVRVFDLKNARPEEIIAWYLTFLEGSREELRQSPARKSYFCYGGRNPARKDTTHGFAAVRGERAMFLDFYQTEDKLYLTYAESAISTFNPFRPLFLSLLD